MKALWVWATTRFSSLRGSGISAFPFGLRGRSKPGWALFVTGRSGTGVVVPVFRRTLSGL